MPASMKTAEPQAPRKVRSLIGLMSEHRELAIRLAEHPDLLVIESDPLSGASILLAHAPEDIDRPTVLVDARVTGSALDLAMAIATAGVTRLAPPSGELVERRWHVRRRGTAALTDPVSSWDRSRRAPPRLRDRRRAAPPRARARRRAQQRRRPARDRPPRRPARATQHTGRTDPARRAARRAPTRRLPAAATRRTH